GPSHRLEQARHASAQTRCHRRAAFSLVVACARVDARRRGPLGKPLPAAPGRGAGGAPTNLAAGRPQPYGVIHHAGLLDSGVRTAHFFVEPGTPDHRPLSDSASSGSGAGRGWRERWRTSSLTSMAFLKGSSESSSFPPSSRSFSPTVY